MDEGWIKEKILEQRYYNMIEGFESVTECDEIPFECEEDVA